MRRRERPLIDYADYLRSMIGCADPVILEIGCNDGADTEKLLKLFPNAEMHCFEPDPRAIKKFHERFSGDPRVVLRCCAVADFCGTATFHQSTSDDDWDMSGSLNAPTGHLEYSPWCRFDRDIEVTVIALDSLDDEVDEVSLIWLDVQGAEAKVIRGGRDVLRRTKYLYTEYGHWKRPLYEGQMSLDETTEFLGGDWRLLGTYEGYNALYENRGLT